MNCPNCGKEMKHRQITGYEPDFGGTADEDELKVTWDKYTCKDCKISYDGTEWKIPKALRPTEKQVKTLLFINNRLHLNLEPITRQQCWRDTNKYFKTARKIASQKEASTHADDEYYNDLAERMGVTEADLC